MNRSISLAPWFPMIRSPKTFPTRQSLNAAIPLLLAMALVSNWPALAVAQRDSIDLVSGRPLRGTIQSSSPAGLVIETADGPREVAGWQIRRVKFEDEPNELTRARSAYTDDRYNVTLQELESLSEIPDRPLIVQDIEYYRAMASARTALTGGGITANQAAELVRGFIDQHPDSYMRAAAQEALADLTLALGNFEQSSRMFGVLATSDWPEVSFQSRIKQGRALILEKKYAEAAAELQKVEAVDSAEDYVLQGKSIARCLRAEALAFAGQSDEARVIAMDTIRNSDARNTVLFAYAYNALGASHLQKGELKDAARAYLHTDLLFTADPDAHAEALYQLAQIWPRLDREDRALEARQKIKDRYRNTFWAAALDGN